MAEPSYELMLTILQDVQAALGDVKKTLGDHSARLAHIDEQVSDLKLQFTYTLGLAAGADFKAQTATRDSADTDKRMDELTARIEQLEKTR